MERNENEYTNDRIHSRERERERERERIKIATCHTCHWPIYQGDLIHHSSTGSHSGTVDSYGVSQETRGTTFHSSSGDYQGTSHNEA